MTGPGVTITASEVNDGDVSDHSSISLIFTLSETSSDFFVDDVAVTNGTLSEFKVIIGSVNKRYTATFTPTEEGPTSIKVASDKFTDLEGNNNTTSNEFNWTYLALMPDPTLKKDVVGSVEAWSNMASRWGYRNIDAVHDRLRWLDRNKDSTKTSHQGIKVRFKNKVVDKIMNDTPKSIDSVLDNVQSSVVGSLGCTSHVINRSSQTDTSSPKTGSTSNDLRPNSYTVKKGDNLYRIGLEHGYDYREIAAANNIDAPYSIRVGQKLNFSSLNTKESIDDVKPSTYENEDGIIVYSIGTEEIAQANSETELPKTVSATEPSVTPVLIRPKATREPYSLEALNRTAPVAPTKVAATPITKKVESKEAKMQGLAPPVKTAPIEAKPAVVGGVTWSWPAQGKVSTRFNAASNKGINITGEKGQPIIAASAGKVIYTGADLRGYGKLVIIKHSKTLLSVYAHNSKINVKEGQIIKAGQKIAEMGDTDTDKVKLHFEIRQKGKSVDPERFLPKS